MGGLATILMGYSIRKKDCFNLRYNKSPILIAHDLGINSRIPSMKSLDYFQGSPSDVWDAKEKQLIPYRQRIKKDNVIIGLGILMLSSGLVFYRRKKQYSSV